MNFRTSILLCGVIGTVFVLLNLYFVAYIREPDAFPDTSVSEPKEQNVAQSNQDSELQNLIDECDRLYETLTYDKKYLYEKMKAGYAKVSSF